MNSLLQQKTCAILPCGVQEWLRFYRVIESRIIVIPGHHRAEWQPEVESTVSLVLCVILCVILVYCYVLIQVYHCRSMTAARHLLEHLCCATFRIVCTTELLAKSCLHHRVVHAQSLRIGQNSSLHARPADGSEHAQVSKASTSCLVLVQEQQLQLISCTTENLSWADSMSAIWL